MDKEHKMIYSIPKLISLDNHPAATGDCVAGTGNPDCGVGGGASGPSGCGTGQGALVKCEMGSGGFEGD